jgi:hypothetical protein
MNHRSKVAFGQRHCNIRLEQKTSIDLSRSIFRKFLRSLCDPAPAKKAYTYHSGGFLRLGVKLVIAVYQSNISSVLRP